MKVGYKVLSVVMILLALSISTNAQIFENPASMNALVTSVPITVDGALTESVWSGAYDYLKFGPILPTQPMIHSVSGEVFVKGTALTSPDLSHTTVKFLRNGLDLYIGISSDDKSVCRWGDSWEGDGLFMKIKNAAGETKEIKLYYNATGVNPDVVLESGLPAGAVVGASVKGSTTIVNDTTQVDNGYTMELLIHLDQIGFTSATQYVEVLMNIFDPDGYLGNEGPWGTYGTFYKSFWGAEWDPADRKIYLSNEPVLLFKNPVSMNALITTEPITVDGALTEASWNGSYDYLEFGPVIALPDNALTVSGEALVKGPYTEQSHASVKFLRSGLDLYIGISSDDKSVCRFGDSWEGDGLFMKIKNAAGETKEIKLYYNATGVNPNVVLESGLPAGAVVGASVKGSNTIVNDTTQVDNGYTMEMVIHLDQIGFTSATQYVEVLMNIFDPDGYLGNEMPWGTYGTFYKSFWGAEWDPADRKIYLSNSVMPVELTSFAASTTTNGVDLTWSTATEVNNRGFEIQRSNDGVNFNTVGFAKGNGTTTEKQSYSYFDQNTVVGSFYYRLKQLDFDGSYEFSNTVMVDVAGPTEFKLSQNYPNPFNPSTTLQFAIPENSHVVVKIFDMLGKEVATAVNDNFAAGTHKQVFNASRLASGNYIYQLNVTTETGKTLNTAKTMTLLK